MNSNYQQKLFNYQEVPPSDCWEKIASNLTDDTAFPQKLYNYQAKPNAAVWQKIANILEKQTTKSYRILSRRIAPYTAVAAAVIVVAFLAFFTLQQRSASAPVSNVPVKQETRPVVVQSNNSGTNESTANTSTSSSSSTLYTPTANPEKRQPANTVASTVAKRTSSSTLTERIISKIKASSENNSATTASYLSFTDGDVKVKVTKKVLPLINCPEGDASCMERIKALQEKISSASMNADFSGFIEILRHVQENY